jgi:hypothetical protein
MLHCNTHCSDPATVLNDTCTITSALLILWRLLSLPGLKIGDSPGRESRFLESGPQRGRARRLAHQLSNAPDSVRMTVGRAQASVG